MVALEPGAGFLLVEQYWANRKAAAWTRSLQVARVWLNVAVIQGSSDEATALHRHVEVDLGAHHLSLIHI